MTAFATAPPRSIADLTSSRGASIVAALWIWALYSNFPVYLGLFVLPTIQPVHWILLLFLLCFFVLRGSETSDERRSVAFPGVLTAYVIICLVWYVGAGGGDPVVLRVRMLGVLVCGFAYVLFTFSPRAMLSARRALVWVCVVSTCINAWDISHPFYFVPRSSEFAELGRAAGLFVNPNQSGAALVLGFALSVGVVSRGWRLPYLVVIAAGVVLTLSRAAILGLLLVWLGLAATGKSLNFRDLRNGSIATGVIAWIVWSIAAYEIQERLKIRPDFILDRLLWVLDPAGRADFSQDERIELLQAGWQQFLASPLWGNGVGSTEYWQLRTSTHNLYVQLASDFGVIGFLVLPAIVGGFVGAAWVRRSDAFVASIFVLFWGFFSHNVFTEYYLMTGIALAAALAHAPDEQLSAPAAAWAAGA